MILTVSLQQRFLQTWGITFLGHVFMILTGGPQGGHHSSPDALQEEIENCRELNVNKEGG